MAEKMHLDLANPDDRSALVQQYLGRLAESPNPPKWYHHFISAIGDLLRLKFNFWTDSDTRVLLEKSRLTARGEYKGGLYAYSQAAGDALRSTRTKIDAVIHPFSATPAREDSLRKFLKLKVNSDTRQVMQRVFARLDGILGGQRMERIVMDHRFSPTTGGIFKVRYGEGGISIDPRGQWRHLTAIHEIAHWIEFGILGEKWGNLEKNKAALAKLVSTVENTPTIKAIDRSTREGAYLTKPAEIFARSLAQYVAERSGDAVLMRELKALEKKNKAAVLPEEEFVPARKILDRIFSSSDLK